MFENRRFFITNHCLASCIYNLDREKLNSMTIESYLAALESLFIDCVLGFRDLNVYSYPVLYMIIIGIRRFMGEKKASN